MPDDAPDAISALLDERLIGEQPHLTRDQTVARTGIDAALADRLWRALGFVSTADDDPAFTEADVEALALMCGLVSTGVVTEEEAVVLARTVGSVMSRLAETLSTTMLTALRDDGERHRGVPRAASPAEEVDLLTSALPLLDGLQHYVYRRHLAAALVRGLRDTGGAKRTLAVGFVDVAGYTAMSRRIDENALVRLVERLEERVGDEVNRRGGRVVKTVGDGILFTAPSAAAAAAGILALLDTAGTDDDPSLHAGLAVGDVVLHQGDVVGSTVNLASRLTDLARPGSLLCDRAAADLLAEVPGMHLRTLRPQRVRGYEHLVAHVVRRVEGMGAPAYR